MSFSLSTGGRRHRLTALVAPVAVFATLIAGCSSSKKTPAAAASSSSPAAAATSAAAPTAAGSSAPVTADG